jgi:hypothetical protein
MFDRVFYLNNSNMLFIINYFYFYNYRTLYGGVIPDDYTKCLVHANGKKLLKNSIVEDSGDFGH